MPAPNIPDEVVEAMRAAESAFLDTHTIREFGSLTAHCDAQRRAARTVSRGDA